MVVKVPCCFSHEAACLWISVRVAGQLQTSYSLNDRFHLTGFGVPVTIVSPLNIKHAAFNLIFLRFAKVHLPLPQEQRQWSIARNWKAALIGLSYSPWVMTRKL
jgi:hypothetical protein